VAGIGAAGMPFSARKPGQGVVLPMWLISNRVGSTGRLNVLMALALNHADLHKAAPSVCSGVTRV
jgi:hypothetical protein